MAEQLRFSNREEFRSWLMAHCLSPDGVWLIFEKEDGPKTLTASEALEEALCFGWIDGQMKRIDEHTYQKYFSQRRENSKWSEKNKGLVAQLEQHCLMTDYGRAKIEDAKQNGQWAVPKAPAITTQEIASVAALLQGHEPAYTNFEAMSLSVQKTYTKGYFAAKTAEGQKKRLAWMIDRLNQNLKPM